MKIIPIVKNTLIAGLLLSFFSLSCTKKINISTEIDAVELDEGYLLQENMDVPVIPGKFSVVTYNGDTLAVAGIETTISVPKGATLRSDNELKIQYVDYDKLPGYNPEHAVSESLNLLLFEDTFHGDHDYNDLVLLVESNIEKDKKESTIEISIKPIALGGTTSNPITFGYVEDPNFKKGSGVEGNVVILSRDVRTDYFRDSKDKSLIINTRMSFDFDAPLKGVGNESRDEFFPSKSAYDNEIEGSYKVCRNDDEFSAHIEYAERKMVATNNNGSKRDIIFFFEIRGKRLYVATVDRSIDNCLPGCISIPCGKSLNSLYYPQENVIMGKAFPDFDRWISNKGQNNSWYKNPDMQYVYTKHQHMLTDID